MIRRTAAFLATSALVFFTATPTRAIQKVAPTWGFVEFSGGLAKPVGSYSGVIWHDFIDESGHSFDAGGDELFDGGYFFRVAVGGLHRGKLQGSLGFSFSENQVNNPFVTGDGYTNSWTYGGGPTLVADIKQSQYDLDVNLNYLPIDLHQQPFSPYVGLGLHGGLTSLKARDIDAEWQGSAAISLNFGAELKVYQDGNKSFVTLASINNWNFAATGERAKYLQIGGGLRWYFKS